MIKETMPDPNSFEALPNPNAAGDNFAWEPSGLDQLDITPLAAVGGDGASLQLEDGVDLQALQVESNPINSRNIASAAASDDGTCGDTCGCAATWWNTCPSDCYTENEPRDRLIY